MVSREPIWPRKVPRIDRDGFKSVNFIRKSSRYTSDGFEKANVAQGGPDNRLEKVSRQPECFNKVETPLIYFLGPPWPNLFLKTIPGTFLARVGGLKPFFCWGLLGPSCLSRNHLYSTLRSRQVVSLETISNPFLGISWPKLSILKPSLDILGTFLAHF